MKLDVNYCTEYFNDINKLNLKLDNLRLCGLSNIEELYELLIKNKSLLDAHKWQTQTILMHLELIINTLKKEI